MRFVLLQLQPELLDITFTTRERGALLSASGNTMVPRCEADSQNVMVTIMTAVPRIY